MSSCGQIEEGEGREPGRFEATKVIVLVEAAVLQLNPTVLNMKTQGSGPRSKDDSATLLDFTDTQVETCSELRPPQGECFRLEIAFNCIGLPTGQTLRGAEVDPKKLVGSVNLGPKKQSIFADF